MKKLKWNLISWKKVFFSAFMMMVFTTIWSLVFYEFSLKSVLFSGLIFPFLGVMLILFPPKSAINEANYIIEQEDSRSEAIYCTRCGIKSESEFV